MTIDISHQRNPATGWDVTTKVTADKGEKITHVEIRVNDFPEFNKDIIPIADSWKKGLIQQGNFPGDNRVVVVATNDKGNDATAIDEWS